MGNLIYGSGAIAIPDRALAHLQTVVIDKLRRDESFSLTLELGNGGHQTMLLGPSVEVIFQYTGNRAPRLNRAWLENLSEAGYRAEGLFLVPEPDELLEVDPGV